MSAASLAAAAEGDHVALLASGAWTVERAAELERLIEDASRRHAGARSIDIDLAGLERLDTFGAWLIERLKRSFLRRGSAARITGLSETDRALMAELRAVNQVPFKKRAAPNAILVALNAVGRNVAEISGSLVLVVQLLGALVLAALGTIAHPRRLRFTSIVHHLEKVGWRAVPIIVLSTFMIGAILAQQGIFRFRTFGADMYVVDMVAVLVLREIGVLIVCVMVAGRSGSAYTAEIGSMKMREEIDAPAALNGRQRRAIEQRWGVLFQQGALFSSLTALQNVQFPMREYLRLSPRLMDEIALAKLEMVGLREDVRGKYPAELSGGMIKRVALARALALDPDIVFLDEPTSGLDPIGAADFDELIRTLQQTLGLSVFMVTHDLDSLHAVCDRIAVLSEGRVIATGPIEAMLASEHPWLRSYFGGKRGRQVQRPATRTSRH
jgi:ABC-type transporter Mla maintaining outer membrane lipid asymmetry ATPase subunit MlaF/anti-anti-sigma regulatory factor